jgi:hypothetical protein
MALFYTHAYDRLIAPGFADFAAAITAAPPPYGSPWPGWNTRGTVTPTPFFPTRLTLTSVVKLHPIKSPRGPRSRDPCWTVRLGVRPNMRHGVGVHRKKTPSRNGAGAFPWLSPALKQFTPRSPPVKTEVLQEAQTVSELVVDRGRACLPQVKLATTARAWRGHGGG